MVLTSRAQLGIIWHPQSVFVSNFLKYPFQTFNWIFSPQYLNQMTLFKDLIMFIYYFYYY